MLRKTEARSELVEHIEVPKRHRIPTEAAIDDMARSLQADGLLMPIFVRDVQDSPDMEHIEVVCGATRLAAAKRLGWEEIDVQFVEGDEVDIQLAEIIENLKRTELTVTERAEHVAEYARLTEEKMAQVEPFSKNAKAGAGRGNKGGEREAARELGLDRNEVQRSKKIASITLEAKAAAKEAGLDDNQSALLKVASALTPEAQIARVREIQDNKAHASGAPPDDFDAKAAWIAQGKAWWNRGLKEWREEFILTCL